MPWSMKDYPVSMKNLKPLVRKKAIDIANALLANDYPDDSAIPIAISQAKAWYDHASSAERQAFDQEAAPKQSDKHELRPNAAKLLDADVHVLYQDDNWIVQSEGAKQADQSFSTKKEAISRAREIALNKGTRVKIYKRDGSLDRFVKPRRNDKD